MEIIDQVKRNLAQFDQKFDNLFMQEDDVFNARYGPICNQVISHSNIYSDRNLLNSSSCMVVVQAFMIDASTIEEQLASLIEVIESLTKHIHE